MQDGGGETDETLARRIQAGDKGALELLVRRYVRPVQAVVASFLPEPAQVEDAAQETFLRALRAIDTYDPGRPFAPWLYQIARNVARNQIHAEAVRRTEPLALHEPRTGGPSPEEAAEHAEVRDRVGREVALLPEQRRTAFRLVEVEGMTAAETGRLMGISPGTVRSHVHHARKHLRRTLADLADATEETGG
jgi:RNA polymerase sigma-70 factor (ECF subfamily)